MIDLDKKKGMIFLRTKLISASYSFTSKFNIENLCKMKDNKTEDIENAFEDELNVIVVKTKNYSNNDKLGLSCAKLRNYS